MNQERREQIAATLRQYREMVLQHNLFLLRTLVEKVEAQPAPPNCPESVAQELRMQAMNELIEAPESIKLPQDVLDEGVISLLISSASLEGVDDDPVDPSRRREYFAGLKAKIEERRVEVAEFPPSDLEYLCTLFDFITPLRRGKIKDMMEAVGVPVRNDAGEVEHNQLTWLWEEWEIAIAFKIGGGPRGWGGSYALYCKNEGRD
ncbi:uncharacterized protein FRV6_04765 [Fusarium oxysporum]|uniref:Uncharacterized protein n=1 Tax=Fusarium oxysporum TaxID=5507 RepID=A0A2H3SVW6_FUSOX|nr:uncharacterized protein FRV6_04765 [Fusarium oxysporum]